MRILMASFWVFAFAAAPSYGIGDAVMTVEKTETESRQVNTSFERDGVCILRVVELPHTGYLKQTIFWDDIEIAEFIRHQGADVSIVNADAPVSVAFTRREDGTLVQVELSKDEFSGIELFSVEEGRLTPVSGAQLEGYRELAGDLQELLDPENMKEMTDDEFVRKALETAVKHRESGAQSDRD